MGNSPPEKVHKGGLSPLAAAGLIPVGGNRLCHGRKRPPALLYLRQTEIGNFLTIEKNLVQEFLNIRKGDSGRPAGPRLRSAKKSCKKIVEKSYNVWLLVSSNKLI